MRLIVLLSLILFVSNLSGRPSPPSSQYDKNFDYSRFIGRMTDKDDSGNIFKIFSKNTIVKLLRSGDTVFFKRPLGVERYCKGSVRNTEEANYFVLHVQNLAPCLKKGEERILRGSKLQFLSQQLNARVKEAHHHYDHLLKKRKNFLKQLNEINHFLWTYRQQKIKTTAKYGQEIVKLQKAQQRAMDVLKEKKKDSILLQRELNQRIDKLDQNLDFYYIEKKENIRESWKQDPRVLF